jgi:hypothetical protein
MIMRMSHDQINDLIARNTCESQIPSSLADITGRRIVKYQLNVDMSDDHEEKEHFFSGFNESFFKISKERRTKMDAWIECDLHFTSDSIDRMTILDKYRLFEICEEPKKLHEKIWQLKRAYRYLPIWRIPLGFLS